MFFQVFPSRRSVRVEDQTLISILFRFTRLNLQEREPGTIRRYPMRWKRIIRSPVSIVILTPYGRGERTLKDNNDRTIGYTESYYTPNKHHTLPLEGEVKFLLSHETSLQVIEQRILLSAGVEVGV